MNSSPMDHWAQRHLEPLGISVTQAELDGNRAEHPDRRYSTPGAVEAFYRLRAAQTGLACPRLIFAPAVPAHEPVVIAAGRDRLTHLHYGGNDYVADGPAELTTLLETAPIRAGTPRHPVLVTDGPATLRMLRSIATNGNTQRETAAGVDWLIQRAEHPGSTAAYVLGRELARRWVAGTHPTTRLSLDDWAGWLNLPTERTPARTAAELAGHLASGSTLLGLLDFAEDDAYSWDRLGKSMTHWRHSDSRSSAALGLLSRSHAAELYDSLAYTDPLVADLHTRTGTILEAVVTAADHSSHQITVETTNTLNRHRVGSRLQAWAGDATRAADPAGATAVTSAVLASITVTASSTLRLDLVEVIAPGRPKAGDPLTLRPKAVDPWHQRKYRSSYAAHYRSPGNVFTRRQQIPTTRRPVPLDVVVAAADGD